MRDDELDRILDAALERYSDVEPLGGLSERILRCVGGQRTSRARLWMAAVAFATAVLAGVVAFHFNYRTDTDPVVPHPRRVVAQREEFPSIVVRPVRRLKSRMRHPKQPVFPMPTPMTSEERSLVALANSGPGVFPDVVKSAEPILIVPVEVTPVVTELIGNPN